jgi:hypothetical protein
MNMYNEQGGSVSMLEDCYQGLFSDSYKSLQENANIFDLNPDKDKYEDLTFDKLKLRKSLSTSQATPLPQANSLGSGPGGFLECLKAPPLPSKATRGATMESRFRLSSISETEELLKMR